MSLTVDKASRVPLEVKSLVIIAALAVEGTCFFCCIKKKGGKPLYRMKWRSDTQKIQTLYQETKLYLLLVLDFNTELPQNRPKSPIQPMAF